MRILQLCKKFPYPLKDGEAIAIMNLTRSFYNQGHEVQLLCMNTRKHYFKIEDLPLGIRKFADFGAVDIDTTPNIQDAIKAIFSPVPYLVKRFISKQFEAKLIQILSENKFDIIHCEGIFLAPYIDLIKRYSSAPISLRAHNIESDIWQRLAENQKFGVKKWYLKKTAEKMANFEKDNFSKFDLIIPISDIDADIITSLGCDKPMLTIPSGFDFEDKHNISNENGSGVFFIGGLDWLPNQEGIKWFIEEIFPLILKAKPDVKFYIAGRNMPDWLSDFASGNIVIEGEVEDAIQFMNKRSVMVVPLLSGSGMRIKIVEALALKKLVVTTSVGAEGVAYKNNVHLMIADDSKQFAASVLKCLNDSEFGKEMRENGHTFVRENLDNNYLGKKLSEFYRKHI